MWDGLTPPWSPPSPSSPSPFPSLLPAGLQHLHLVLQSSAVHGAESLPSPCFPFFSFLPPPSCECVFACVCTGMHPAHCGCLCDDKWKTERERDRQRERSCVTSCMYVFSPTVTRPHPLPSKYVTTCRLTLGTNTSADLWQTLIIKIIIVNIPLHFLFSLSSHRALPQPPCVPTPLFPSNHNNRGVGGRVWGD